VPTRACGTSSTQTSDPNTGQLFILGFPLVAFVLIWLLAALVAAGVAPADPRGTFFILTLLLFGPLDT
jgi:hypothetical protein